MEFKDVKNTHTEGFQKIDKHLYEILLLFMIYHSKSPVLNNNFTYRIFLLHKSIR